MSQVKLNAKISLCGAFTVDGGYGKDGKLPWELAIADDLKGMVLKRAMSQDMMHFREATAGKVIVMGGATYRSLPTYPHSLPGRTAIVLSSTEISKRDFDGKVAELMGYVLPASDVVLISGEGNSLENTIKQMCFDNYLKDGSLETEFVFIGGAEIWNTGLTYAARLAPVVIKQADVDVAELEYWPGILAISIFKQTFECDRFTFDPINALAKAKRAWLDKDLWHLNLKVVDFQETDYSCFTHFVAKYGPKLEA